MIQFSPIKGCFGGAEGDRTPDLYNAIVALSQLSYGPFMRSLLYGLWGSAQENSPMSYAPFYSFDTYSLAERQRTHQNGDIFSVGLLRNGVELIVVGFFTSRVSSW